MTQIGVRVSPYGKSHRRSYSTVHTATPANIVATVSALNDGEAIALEDGYYSDVGLSFAADNAEIYAINPGNVVFDATSRVFISGTNSIVSGIKWIGSNGVYAVKFYGATKCLLRQAYFLNCGVDAYKYRPLVVFENGATHCRVTTSIFEGSDCISVGVNVQDGETLPTYNTVSACQFRNIAQDTGKESIQIGSGDRADEATYTTVNGCLFNDCDGDPEIISIKTGNNTISNNVAVDSNGGIVLRAGNYNTVSGNIVASCAVGVRVHGTNHTINNNLLVDNTIGISIPAGASTYAVGGGLHDAATNCNLNNNLVVSNTTSLFFDDWYDGATYDTYPSAITLTGNVIANTDAQTLLNSVQDVFTWNNNQYSDLDWTLTSSPDSDKYTLITAPEVYYEELENNYTAWAGPDYSTTDPDAYGAHFSSVCAVSATSVPGTLTALVDLPEFTDSGALSIGSWYNTRSSVVNVVGSDGNLQELPIETLAYENARWVDEGGTLVPYNRDVSGNLLDPQPYLKHQPEATNYFLQSFNPTTQTISGIPAGNVVVSMRGTGSVTLSGDTTGSVTEGSPVTYTGTGVGASLTCTIVGTVDAVQVERGTTPTSFIETMWDSEIRTTDVIRHPRTTDTWNNDAGAVVFEGSILNSDLATKMSNKHIFGTDSAYYTTIYSSATTNLRTHDNPTDANTTEVTGNAIGVNEVITIAAWWDINAAEMNIGYKTADAPTWVWATKTAYNYYKLRDYLSLLASNTNIWKIDKLDIFSGVVTQAEIEANY